MTVLGKPYPVNSAPSLSVYPLRLDRKESSYFPISVVLLQIHSTKLERFRDGTVTLSVADPNPPPPTPQPPASCFQLTTPATYPHPLLPPYILFSAYSPPAQALTSSPWPLFPAPCPFSLNSLPSTYWLLFLSPTSYPLCLTLPHHASYSHSTSPASFSWSVWS